MGNGLEHFEGSLPVKEVGNQIRQIQVLMKTHMKKDEHYGVIPGCKKPSLYKAGAEKLNFMFRLAPSFDVERIDLPRGHVKYVVKCTLSHISTNLVWGQGVGSCSTMESKFRWEWKKVSDTVPQEYWKERDVSVLGGEDFDVRNYTSGSKKIYYVAKRFETNPADKDNTALKIAKKRALVDADLTATAASDIFTQDLEDFPELVKDDDVIDVKPKTIPEDELIEDLKQEGDTIKEGASPAQIKKILDVTKSHFFDNDKYGLKYRDNESEVSALEKSTATFLLEYVLTKVRELDKVEKWYTGEGGLDADTAEQRMIEDWSPIIIEFTGDNDADLAKWIYTVDDKFNKLKEEK